MDRGMKPRKKRVMEPSTEPVMEREMRELKAYIHDQNQEMKRELKAYNQEMKCSTVTLCTQEIEFVVLDDAEDQEFNAINHRNKGPLLKGKVTITLTAGVGTIHDLSFGDNSSWRRTKKFKLGARVKQSSIMGQVRIKEAISEAFVVKDHRGKRARKHDLPSSKDEVWHLKKIKKYGKFHTRLIDNNIHTVGDFSDMHRTKPNKLREILKDCTDQDWKALEQDVTCAVLDDVSTVLHQGTVGMQKDNNYASSSHHKSTGPSPAVCLDLAMSTNAQGEQGDLPFQKLSNSDSGRNSSQILSEAITHPTTESSQNDSGLHSHISEVQSAYSALDDGKLNADSNPLITQKTYDSPTTGQLPHESPGLHQGFAGMHKNYNNASLSHHNSGFFQHQNNGYGDPGLTQPQFNGSDSLCIQSSHIRNGLSPTTGQLPHESLGLHQGFVGMHKNYNNASLSHHNSEFFQHQNNGYGDPGQTQPQFNRSDSLCIQSSQIRNGLSPATGQLPHESPGLHQGFAGMHKNSNSASLSHHNSGFFQHHNNGYDDPGQTQPQFNRSDSLRMQSSQIRNGLSPTTGQQPHGSPGLHQGFAGMHKNSNNASLSHHNSGFFQHQNNGYGDPGQTQPQFNRSDSLCIQSSQIRNGLSPTTGQLPHESPGLHQGFAGMHKNYNNASLSHHNSGFFQHQNNGYGDPGQTQPQFNGSDSLCIQSSQIRNGLHAQYSAAEQYPQNTVMPPSDSSNEHAATVGNLTPNSMQNRQL
ncbi:hypothetical protein EZV62_006490 [Acer yangbiense]|uniref:Uncharacterized protein n=1 Tax=Acer yangbiense TaxID=1000413 RepID=A0A5C7I7R3_9ROSI|nr:hypothetical protein EZV62_006490 [Acer yangbiense]